MILINIKSEKKPKMHWTTFDVKHLCSLLLIIGGLFFCLTLSSCVDNDIYKFETNNSENDIAEETSLKFKVNLGQEAKSRDGEINTNLQEGNVDFYIDTANKFQVLFFDEEGHFLFRPTGESIEVEPSNDIEGQWYVTIHLNNSLKTSDDANGKSILSLVKAQLEKEPFRIAVLANWSKNTNGEVYSIDWGWNQSSLNKEATDKKTVNDLHHIKDDDSTYKGSSSYSFIMKDGKIGHNTEWVQMREIKNGVEIDGTTSAWYRTVAPEGTFSKTEEAFDWIRNNWEPAYLYDANNTEHGLYRHYKRLWLLWNFGGSFEDSKVSYENLGIKEIGDNDNFRSQWKQRNGNRFAAFNDNENDSTWCYWDAHWLKNFQVNDGVMVISNETKDSESDGSGYIRSLNTSVKNPKYPDFESGRYGIILPKMDASGLNPKSVSNNKPWIESYANNKSAREYLKFEVPGSGTLRVLFSSLKKDENATLIVQRGSNHEAMFTTTSGLKIMEIGKDNSVRDWDPTSNKDYNYGYQVKMNQDPEDIILFAYEGSVVIYAIEFVCDEYLAGTDREGIVPTPTYPIPMYGIQKFSSIDTWGAQKLITLRDHISLIRALAKVELYFPKDFDITHVYLRSMNRKARSEPMDVLNSTGEHWKAHPYGDEGDCEWFSIWKHGAAYKGNFSEWFSWFYGTWTEWGWEGITYSDETNNPPHLFNPDVQRSDFCHFIHDINYNDGTYQRYFLYVPDKNISDPNSVGNLNSSPKVCHIEYRTNDNSIYLDDNNCKRIYFTDYATNPVIKGIKHNEYESDKYEMNNDYLNLNWPIMRNHIYRFYIGGTNSPQDIRVKVIPWSIVDPKIYEW